MAHPLAAAAAQHPPLAVNLTVVLAQCCLLLLYIMPLSDLAWKLLTQRCSPACPALWQHHSPAGLAQWQARSSSLPSMPLPSALAS